MYLRNRLSKYPEKNNSSIEQKNYLESDHLNNRVKLIHSGNQAKFRTRPQPHFQGQAQMHGIFRKYFRIIAQRINLFSSFREEQSLMLITCISSQVL